MKWYLLIASILVIIIAVAFFIFFPKTPSEAPVGGGGGTTLPTAGSSNVGGQSSSGGSASFMDVATVGTSTVSVQDFLNNGTTVEDVQNPGQYYLAGAMGYCLEDGSCPSGAPSDEYHVVYLKQDQAFLITLIAEPLSKARTDAEQFLEKTLGINQTQMCALKYYLSTTNSVNSFYAGKNLGFSFCPGAVQLPQ